jgi:hypothetical protein
MSPLRACTAQGPLPLRKDHPVCCSLMVRLELCKCYQQWIS